MSRFSRDAAIERAVAEGNNPGGERVEWMDQDRLEAQGRHLLQEDGDERE